MKTKLLYLATAAMACFGLWSCDDDIEQPPLIIPSTDLVANTTIADLKAEYWSSDRNSANLVPARADGTHTIIRGRVISMDASGNIYKAFYLDDGSAAITVSADTTKLYKQYQFGQEVLIDVTGLYIGFYNGLMQLGGLGEYNGTPSMTFMSTATLKAHVFPNGLPDFSTVDTTTVTIAEVLAAKKDAAQLRKWQGRLVRFDDVQFIDAGKQFSVGTNTDRYIKDDQGKRINIRCSYKASFCDATIPYGKGSIVGILSTYGTDWQVLMLDQESYFGFDGTVPDTPDIPVGTGDGTEANPYTVGQIIDMSPQGNKDNPDERDKWVTGYIVGWADMSSIYYINEETARFETPATAPTNILIAATPDVKEFDQCLGIQLPSGAVRSALNLVDNPGNLGKKLEIKGNICKYSGIPGMRDASQYKLEGQGGGGDTPTPPAGDAIFSESFENGSLGQFTTTLETSGTWTGWRANTKTPLCAIANSFMDGTNEAATAWLISPAIDLGKVTTASISVEQAFGFYFPTTQESFCTMNIREVGGEWNALTLTEFPSKKATGNWTDFAANTIDISAYAGKTVEIGFKYVNDGKQSIAWEIKNFVINGTGSVTVK